MNVAAYEAARLDHMRAQVEFDRLSRFHTKLYHVAGKYTSRAWPRFSDLRRARLILRGMKETRDVMEVWAEVAMSALRRARDAVASKGEA